MAEFKGKMHNYDVWNEVVKHHDLLDQVSLGRMLLPARVLTAAAAQLSVVMHVRLQNDHGDKDHPHDHRFPSELHGSE